MTGWEIALAVLGAKAADGSVAKLIETLSAATGALYEPTRIRRKARAEGDALVIMEEAKERASEISIRAAQRLLSVEERRQENLEAIARIAAAELPDEVSTDPVEPDWTARFLRQAQDISEEAMRVLWGRLLAREVARPGSFSTRTLTVVGDLSRKEAELFEGLCSYVGIVKGFGPRLLLPRLEAPHLQSLGLLYETIVILADAGLIRVESTGLVILDTKSRQRTWQIELPGDILFELPPNDQLEIGLVHLTPTGHELFRVAAPRPSLTHQRHLSDNWRRLGKTIERHQIRQRRLDGTFDLEPAPFPGGEHLGGPQS